VQGDTRLVPGTLLSLAAALVWSVWGCISTAFHESSEGTDLHRNSRKARKGCRFPKGWEVHRVKTYFTPYGANFCWCVRTSG